MKRVWRIGTNWGNENIFHLFKKYSIVFAGLEAARQILKVKKEDLICITNGQEIIAICQAEEIIAFDKIDSSISRKYNNVNVIKVSSIAEKSKYPQLDFGIYDGRGKKFSEAHNQYRKLVNENFKEIIKMNTIQEKINLLEFKNQIILQGPPGTGKTRLAKEIAKKMTINSEITNDIILETFYVGQEIESSTKRTRYKVIEVKDDHLVYDKISTNVPGRLNYSEIIDAYRNKIWITKNISNGSDTYSAAFAKFIYENAKSEDQVKIIQFHPAYSYEDFVRGISVSSDNGVVSYRTENKTLATFSNEALKNQLDSEKNEEDYTRELMVNDRILDYAEHLRNIIENEKDDTDEEVQITPSIRITNVEDSAFKFEGKDWYDKLKFDQIKRMILMGIQTSEQIKNTPGFLKTVYHRTTYYLKILQNIRKKYPEVDTIPTQPKKKEKLKKYVLIIDEINRANLPSVLGELIYALEYRNESVNSLYSIDDDNKLTLPKNLYIIGTMNTSDRSVGHMDYAIRRRFAFVDVLPEILTITNFQKETFKKVSSLFISNVAEYEIDPLVKLVKSDCLNDEFRPEDVWLGHSYFIAADAEFKIRKKYEIVPILKEYVKDGILKDIPETWKMIDALER